MCRAKATLGWGQVSVEGSDMCRVLVWRIQVCGGEGTGVWGPKPKDSGVESPGMEI